MTRDFGEWIAGFRESISPYGYYVDFEKVYQNVEEKRVELNILNSLIGSKNIEQDFEDLVARYPDVLECIPLLLAVRQKEILAMDEDGAYRFDFEGGTNSIDEYKMFMRKTGLFDLLENHIINNLVDYATGVEVGLDSNGRKNRGGHQMEDLVEQYIKETGSEYYKEMYLEDIEKRWGLDLSALSNDGKARKRFDFVIKTDATIYAIETNFYASNGSKLNETARSYKMLAQEAKGIDGFEFVWVTDGIGWKSARNNLRETFEETEYVYSLIDLESGAITQLVSSGEEPPEEG